MAGVTEEIGSRLGRFLREASPRGLVSAYLFGGHAAGRAHRESDIDVGVLLAWDVHPTVGTRFEERLRLTALLATALETDRIDLVVLNDVPPTLGRRIVTSGQRVLCFDPGRDHAFVRDVQLRAADLEPFLRRTRRVKLAIIRR